MQHPRPMRPPPEVAAAAITEIRGSSSGEAPPAPPPVPAAPSSAGTPFGRYRLLEPLGAGGMGAVWKAFDLDLCRTVALKVMREELAAGADAAARFSREARLAARLRHPGIVAVHDVGVFAGRPYLTMDLVEGGTFDRRIDETRAARRAGDPVATARLREEIGILADVAAATGHAHEHGVVHRDLKPGNVLLDSAGRPYVTDFGLARELAAAEAALPGAGRARGAGLTVTGQLLGTPLYMSPEQASGDGRAVGPGSDVWALGAMLYEILTGETPFERGRDPWEILRAVVQDDPRPPRAIQPLAPQDLEAVALRALEKDTARRYRSAREFEAELRRWLRGDPVEARCPGAWDRLRRKAARHRAALAGAAVVLGVGVLALSWAGMERASRAAAARRADEADRRAEEKRQALITQLRRVSELALAGLLELRRAGVAGREATFVAASDRAFQEVQREAPELAEPWFHRGRVLRAQQRWEEARAAQGEALSRDPGFAPALYERAVLCAREIGERTVAARERALLANAETRQRAATAAASPTAGDRPAAVPAVPESSDPEAVPWLREMLEAIGGLRTALLARPDWRTEESGFLRVNDARLACVDALYDTYSGGPWEQVAAGFARALELDGGLDEAHEGLARAAIRAGRYGDALAAATRGRQVDRGYAPFRRWRAVAAVGVAMESAARGGDPRERLAEAEAELAPLLACDPPDVHAARLRGLVRLELGRWRAGHGEDAAPDWSAAEADFSRALQADSADFGSLHGRACVRLACGEAEVRRGRDPASPCRDAIEDATRLAELRPGSVPALLIRANAQSVVGESRATAGGDFETPLAGALADLDRAVELDPARATAWQCRGVARSNLGFYRSLRGSPRPADDLAAVADLAHAAQLAPDDARVWSAKGSVHSAAGRNAAARGEDPAAHYAEALAAYERSLALHPNAAETWAGRGLLRHALGQSQEARRLDPREAWVAACRDFDRALELNPATSASWAGRARVRLELATLQLVRGEDPSDDCAAAVADFDRALQLHPNSAQVWLDRGGTRLNWGLFVERRRGDPREHFAAAVADMGRAIELQPDDSAARLARATAGLALAEAQVALGGPAADTITRLTADLDRVLQADPHHKRAKSLLHRAQGLAVGGK